MRSYEKLRRDSFGSVVPGRPIGPHSGTLRRPLWRRLFPFLCGTLLLRCAFFLRRLRQRLRRDLNQLAQPGAILPPIFGDQHARLAAGVGFFHGDLTGKGQPRVGRFYQKAMVADHGDEDVVAIDAVFALSTYECA